jgi:RNA polymerase sigma factor (TIGR02999 family)
LRVAVWQANGWATNLQATALVNEAYVRLLDVQHVSWQNRAHFLAMAARLMRRILVDAARSKRNQKRGGDEIRVTFDEGLAVANQDGHDLVAINDALEAWRGWTSAREGESSFGSSEASAWTRRPSH